MKTSKFLSLLAISTIIGFSGQANAQETLAEKITTPLISMKDDAYIVLSGTIGDIRSDEFDLKYGSDSITVELDRFGWTGNETNYLASGESVTVRGFIDDDFLEGREIEAYSINLNDSYVYYYLADVDPVYVTYDANNVLDEGTFVTTRGTVSDHVGDEFTVTNEVGSIRVDVSLLGYDPFDEVGLQKIENGDRVYVYGDINNDFFDSKEIMAGGLVELSEQ